MTHYSSRGKLIGACLAIGVGVVGCGRGASPDQSASLAQAAGEPIAGETPAVATLNEVDHAQRDVQSFAAPEPAPSEVSTSDDAPLHAGAAGPLDEEREEERVEVVEFVPPYPERTDLFAPPKRPNLEAVVRENGQSSASLVLKGFVNVDGPRAILLIDRNLATLAVGDEKFGVQVVSIEPPQITLQRGRERWTESLLLPDR
jgi:hypothetical protein